MRAGSTPGSTGRSRAWPCRASSRISAAASPCSPPPAPRCSRTCAGRCRSTPDPGRLAVAGPGVTPLLTLGGRTLVATLRRPDGVDELAVTVGAGPQAHPLAPARARAHRVGGERGAHLLVDAVPDRARRRHPAAELHLDPEAALVRVRGRRPHPVEPRRVHGADDGRRRPLRRRLGAPAALHARHGPERVRARRRLRAARAGGHRGPERLPLVQPHLPAPEPRRDLDEGRHPADHREPELGEGAWHPAAAVGARHRRALRPRQSGDRARLRGDGDPRLRLGRVAPPGPVPARPRDRPAERADEHLPGRGDARPGAVRVQLARRRRSRLHDRRLPAGAAHVVGVPDARGPAGAQLSSSRTTRGRGTRTSPTSPRTGSSSTCSG